MGLEGIDYFENISYNEKGDAPYLMRYKIQEIV